MPTTELTARESEVLELVVDGLSNDEVADRLGISRRTAETHVRTLFRKTGATRRGQLARMAAGKGGPDDSGTLGDRRLGLYADAFDQLADRHLALIQEQVELTFWVGDEDGHDHVLERRRTAPKQYLVYRILRPIVADHESADGWADPDELQADCEVHGEDVQVDVCSVLDGAGLPQTLVLFQPGLRTETEWLLRYRSPGLWAPLRRTGADTLTWATATADRRHRPTLTELTVHVLFPESWRDPELIEQSGHGAVRSDRLPGGRTRVSWHQGGPDEPPIPAAYDWVLRGGPAGPSG